jgi:hypothetical protein
MAKRKAATSEIITFFSFAKWLIVETMKGGQDGTQLQVLTTMK